MRITWFTRSNPLDNFVEVLVQCLLDVPKSGNHGNQPNSEGPCPTADAVLSNGSWCEASKCSVQDSKCLLSLSHSVCPSVRLLTWAQHKLKQLELLLPCSVDGQW